VIDINTESLWNGQFSRDVMRDGSVDGMFHQDPMVPGLSGVFEGGRFAAGFGSGSICGSHGEDRAGFVESGRELLLKVARADTVAFGDYCPNEFLDGGGGHEIHGGKACAILPFSLVADQPRDELKGRVRELRANAPP
jgi:hypothetical protein